MKCFVSTVGRWLRLKDDLEDVGPFQLKEDIVLYDSNNANVRFSCSNIKRKNEVHACLVS